MGWQDDEVGHLLFEREDLAGGLGETAPVAYPRNLAAFEQSAP